METMLIFKLTETNQCKMLKHTMSLINMLLSLGPAGFVKCTTTQWLCKMCI